jgi:uncharacterized coiled-coil protein SlyX
MSLDRLQAKAAEYAKAANLHQHKLGALLDQKAELEQKMTGLNGQIAEVRRVLYQNQGATEALNAELRAMAQDIQKEKQKEEEKETANVNDDA